MDTHSKPPTTPSRRRERSHSFSLFNSLLARRRSTQSDALEPIEVAPGVMSTDATAIVFELDPRRTKSASPRKQKDKTEKGEAKGKPASRIPIWGAYRAAHRDDGTDDFSRHPARVATTSYFEKRDRRRDEARMNHLRAEQQTARGRRMRMRDSADYLTVRFANPNTGLVSPSVMSDGGPTPPSEMNRGVVDGGLPSQVVEEQRNGKQIEDLKRQQGDVIRRTSTRWNAARTPALSPVSQSSRTVSPPARRGASNPTVAPGDRLILHMPSAQEPCPFEHPGKTSEQILAYQRGVEAARGQASSGGLVDPSTPPTPRPNSPIEECRTSPRPERSPTMIRRKPVGSAASKKSESEDTVIINGARRSASLPAAPHRSSSTHPAIKVTSPEHITRNLSSISNQTSSHHRPQSQQQPFLGDRADGESTQANGVPYPLNQSQGVENHQHHLQSRQDIDRSRLLHRPLSRLPEVNITHPDLASIPTSQRPRGNKGATLWILRDASTTITPTTTTITGPSLQTEVPRDCDGSLPLSVSRGVYPLRSTSPERRGPQTHRGGSLLANRTRNTEGLVLRTSSTHPPCLVPGPQSQVIYPSTRTSTSTSPQTSPGRTAERLRQQQQQQPMRQGGRSRRDGPPGNSAREAALTKASVTNDAPYGMDVDGGRGAGNDDDTGDPKGLAAGTRSSSSNSNSNSNSDGTPSTVPSEDQLTGWRGVGRWRPPLTDGEVEVREGGRAVKDDVKKKKDKTTRLNKPLRDAAMGNKVPGDQTTTATTTTTTTPAATATAGMTAARTLLASLLAMLDHIRSVCTPWSPTNRLLTSPDATPRDYLAVVTAWALVGLYLVVLACVVSVGVGVVGVVRGVLMCLFGGKG